MSSTWTEYAGLVWMQIWQVTIAAIVVMILVRSLCRHRPHLAYLLWILVLLKCVTPPFLSSPTGVFSWAQLKLVQPISREVAGGDTTIRDGSML